MHRNSEGSWQGDPDGTFAATLLELATQTLHNNKCTTNYRTSVDFDVQWSGLTARLAELDHGDTNALLAAARKLEASDTQMAEIEKALNYFQTNQQRMRYDRFRRWESS